MFLHMGEEKSVKKYLEERKFIIWCTPRKCKFIGQNNIIIFLIVSTLSCKNYHSIKYIDEKDSHEIFHT